MVLFVLCSLVCWSRVRRVTPAAVIRTDRPLGPAPHRQPHSATILMRLPCISPQTGGIHRVVADSWTNWSSETLSVCL